MSKSSGKKAGGRFVGTLRGAHVSTAADKIEMEKRGIPLRPPVLLLDRKPVTNRIQ